MTKMWMVRAGKGTKFINDFLENSVVAIGWAALGTKLNGLKKDEIKSLFLEKYPDESKSVHSAAGVIYKFVNEITTNDYVVSYDSSTRIYHVGRIVSIYHYSEKSLVQDGDYNHYRKVNWYKEIPRDDLDISTKNTLGSLLTLFEIKGDSKRDFLNQIGNKDDSTDEDDEEDIITFMKDDIINQSTEFIKDIVMSLSWDEMQELVAGLLRAMGYKTIVSPAGPDRGKDIIASPDGLGLEDPRVVVEVKHRQGSMGAPEIRSFLGVIQGRDKGLYVSTGGFTKEARYEAERSQYPLTLMDIDLLVRFIIQYYDNFDNDARRLVPLTKIYWPI